MYRFLKTLLWIAIPFFTFYVCSNILRYASLFLMCIVLLVVGSLLYVHIEGASSREALWSMSRKQRQLFHAKNVPYFSVIPLTRERRHQGAVTDAARDISLRDNLNWRPWNESRWR